MRKLRPILSLAAILAIPLPQVLADDLSQQATAILAKYCTACHGPDKQKGEMRLDSAAGFAAGGESKEPLGGPQSLLWKKIAAAEMPPEEMSQPSDAEKLVLKLWIQGGAKYPGGVTAEQNTALAAEAFKVFRTRCYSCHGQQFKAPGLDFNRHEALVLPAAGRSEPFVAAGNPEASLLWKRIISTSNGMPPKGPIPSEEQAIVERWIAAGAPRWPDLTIARTFVSELAVQTAILAHLQSLPESARRHQRYFTFAHLHNSQAVTDEQLALFKAALSKLINSLTWESEIVIPKPVDAQQTVLAIDMRDLDWNERDHWSKLFERNNLADQDERKFGYPYGVDYDINAELANLATQIATVSQSKLPKLVVRADWFIAKASRPPLYHELLELPTAADDLERKLEVTAVDDWLTPDMVRGAVRQSKISHSNRVLDRHRALHGMYWISYDFRSSRGKGDVTANPLGPVFANHPFERVAFQHDGGEIVFTLPNGLNGYLLVDSQKRRISRGPTDIVEDSNSTSGTSAVVTGLSCMSCHKHGVVRFEDVVRSAFKGNGPEARKVEDLFLPVAQINAQLSEDEERFLTALLKAERPFLPVSTIEQLRNLPDEPIGTTARYYQADLTLPVVAAELGFESPEKLVTAAAGNSRVNIILGGMLTQGGVIKREVWDSTDRGNNAFQKIVSELNLGVPGQ